MSTNPLFDPQFKLELHDPQGNKSEHHSRDMGRLFRLAKLQADHLGAVPTITDQYGVKWMRVEDAT